MQHPETIFFLVRHGEAENNTRGVLSSWPEKSILHLTERGREQVTQAARVLAREQVDVIYASPITRTRETAEVIGGQTGVNVILDERLRETDFGVYDGESVEKFRALYPDDIARLEHQQGEMETFEALCDRAKSFVNDVLSLHAGKRIVIVSHGDPLEVIYGLLHQQSLRESLEGWYPPKGSVTKVEWRERGTIQ